MAEAWRVRGHVRVAGRRRVELDQLDFSLAIRGPQHRELRLGADAVDPVALDLGRASRLQSNSTKNSIAAGRSLTTMPTCSIRWIVMCAMVSSSGSSHACGGELRDPTRGSPSALVA